jgi:hypothetical protein
VKEHLGRAESTQNLLNQVSDLNIVALFAWYPILEDGRGVGGDTIFQIRKIGLIKEGSEKCREGLVRQFSTSRNLATTVVL